MFTWLKGLMKSSTPAKVEKAVKQLNDSELAAMTKAKLEAHGREMGVELDRRMTKSNMIADLKSKL